MLPRQSLLEGSPHAEALGPVLDAAERALRTWEPVWTPFLDGALLEQAQERLAGLAELDMASRGGYPGAERQRLLLQRHDAAIAADEVAAGLMGLELTNCLGACNVTMATHWQHASNAIAARLQRVGNVMAT